MDYKECWVSLKKSLKELHSEELTRTLKLNKETASSIDQANEYTYGVKSLDKVISIMSTIDEDHDYLPLPDESSNYYELSNILGLEVDGVLNSTYQKELIKIKLRSDQKAVRKYQKYIKNTKLKLFSTEIHKEYWKAIVKSKSDDFMIDIICDSVNKL